MKQVIFIFLLIFVSSCRKSDPTYSFKQEHANPEGLSVEEDSLIASLPSRSFAASEILLPNGETIEAFLKRTNPAALPKWGARVDSATGIAGGADDAYYAFVSDLLSSAYRMSYNPVKPFTAKDEGEVTQIIKDKPVKFQQPSQIGYAYVWNSDTSLSKRKRAGNCNTLLYGVDCSAMATIMFNNAGLTFPEKYAANTLATEEILNQAMKTSPVLSNFAYRYEIEPYNFDQISAGDVIYFAHDDGEVFHIGIALNAQDGSGIWIYQSNGTNASPGCNTFWPPDRGPHAIPFRKMITMHDRNGNLVWANYRVLHLIPKKNIDPLLLGNWRLTGNSTDLATPYRKIPVLASVVNGSNVIVHVSADETFTIGDNDPSDDCTGSFIVLSNGTEIKLFGCSLFEHDPIKAAITELSKEKLTLLFIIQADEYLQYSTLYFTRK